MLNQGADANLFAANSPPPLHLAAMCGHQEIAKNLIRHGANIHTIDFVQFSALHCATYFGNEQVLIKN